MAEILIAADDLTGGNACAAGFAREGLRAVTTALTGSRDSIPDFGERFDAIVVTTDSRHVTPEAADAVTRSAVRAGWPARLLGCRIDTTLRGNVGPSAAALIDEVRTLSGERTVGLCIAAFPQAGRVTVEGRQLLNGKRLEFTELARDVRTPIRTSSVQHVLSEKTGLTTALLPLHVVSGATEGLVKEIQRLLEQDDLDVIVADALMPEHIDAVAQAAIAAAPHVRWVGIDPGPGSLALAKALGLQGVAPRGRVLAVSGSATELTQRQLAHLIAERDPIVVRPVFREGENLADQDMTAQALIEAVTRAAPGQVILYAQILQPSDVRELSNDEASRLASNLGAIVHRTLKSVAVDGVYSTGGDITAAILNELGSDGVEIHGEVVPLAVSGEVVGGPWAGLSIVTKGGLIGDTDTAIKCIDEIAAVAAQRSRWVRAAAPVTTNHSHTNRSEEA